MIRVMVVEDSPVVREFLIHILTSDPDIQIIASATNGEEALEVVGRKKPDVITMDIHMPKLNGLDATRKIMETYPTPIVIVSGSSTKGEVAITFRAIEAGALALVRRPVGIGHPDHEGTAADLVRMVKLMAEVKVVRRWPRPRPEAPPAMAPPVVEIEKAPAEVKLVAIGASTGGPLALRAILSGLPKGFPVPVVIVQHMAPGFVEGFAEWLAQSSGFPVHVATDSEDLLPGHAYVAPDGFHLGVGGDGRISLSDHGPENGLRPSVSYLFRSAAKILEDRAVGVLLTGMGRDGAEELKQMKERGAVTIVQNRESSVVHGMPGEAINLDAATYVLPPEDIARALTELVASGSGLRDRSRLARGCNGEEF